MPLKLKTINIPLAKGKSWQDSLEILFSSLISGLEIRDDKISFLRGMIWDSGMFNARRAPIEASSENLKEVASQLQLTVSQVPDEVRTRLTEVHDPRRWEERLVSRLLALNLGTLFDEAGALKERPPLSPLWVKKEANTHKEDYLAFVLTHTDVSAFCALCKTTLGIDVEGIKPFHRMKPLIEYLFRRDINQNIPTPFDTLCLWAKDENEFWATFPSLKEKIRKANIDSKSIFERFVTIAATSLWGIEESRTKFRTHRAWQASRSLRSIHSLTNWVKDKETNNWKLIETYGSTTHDLTFGFAISTVEAVDWETLQIGLPLVTALGVDDEKVNPAYPDSLTLTKVEVVEAPSE